MNNIRFLQPSQYIEITTKQNDYHTGSNTNFDQLATKEADIILTVSIGIGSVLVCAIIICFYKKMCREVKQKTKWEIQDIERKDKLEQQEEDKEKARDEKRILKEAEIKKMDPKEQDKAWKETELFTDEVRNQLKDMESDGGSFKSQHESNKESLKKPKESSIQSKECNNVDLNPEVEEENQPTDRNLLEEKEPYSTRSQPVVKEMETPEFPSPRREKQNNSIVVNKKRGRPPMIINNSLQSLKKLKRKSISLSQAPPKEEQGTGANNQVHNYKGDSENELENISLQQKSQNSQEIDKNSEQIKIFKLFEKDGELESFINSTTKDNTGSGNGQNIMENAPDLIYNINTHNIKNNQPREIKVFDIAEQLKAMDANKKVPTTGQSVRKKKKKSKKFKKRNKNVKPLNDSVDKLRNILQQDNSRTEMQSVFVNPNPPAHDILPVLVKNANNLGQLPAIENKQGLGKTELVLQDIDQMFSPSRQDHNISKEQIENVQKQQQQMFDQFKQQHIHKEQSQAESKTQKDKEMIEKIQAHQEKYKERVPKRKIVIGGKKIQNIQGI